MKIDPCRMGSTTNDRQPLPAGAYECVIDEVVEAMSRGGHEMLKLHFRVERGPYAGRIIFDKLVGSPAAMRRVQLLCDVLGIDTDGKFNLTPAMLLNKRCIVRIYVASFEGADGTTRRGNTVLFDGFEALPDSGESVPF